MEDDNDSYSYRCVSRYIGQTKGKGVMYTEATADCPTDLPNWRYLDSDLGWRDNGRITLTCRA